MSPPSSSPPGGRCPRRSEAELIERQRQGTLQVCSAAAYRDLVRREGLEVAYRRTDVVVAANAEFTDQASLLLLLGPCDPPIRVQRFRLGGSEGLGGHGNSDLLVPIGLGGASVLDDLLAGLSLPLSASGVGTAQQPRLELDTRISLNGIGAGRLLLHRAVVENGVVAVSSREGLTTSPWGPVLGPLSSALYNCGGAGSIGLTMPGLSLLGPGSPLLVAGAIGWVSGAGSGHNPRVRRQASGHALSPGAAAALEVDLHGLRRDEAREALQGFLRLARRQGHRCVRVVHGKGLGSPGKAPVLKSKVRAWLIQSQSVLAFVQAPANHGGHGAVLVLLAPAEGPRHSA